MLARPKLKKPSNQGGVSEVRDETRPTEERFLLRVDGQVKRSFSSKEPALIVGGAIKKAYPVVVVSLMDTEDGTTEIVNA